MKKALIFSLLLLTSCTSTVYIPDHGHADCIGIADERDPRLVYEISYWNVVVGFVLAETIIVPLVVLFKSHSCPTSVKVIPPPIVEKN